MSYIACNCQCCKKSREYISNIWHLNRTNESAKVQILLAALEQIVDDPGFAIEGNEAAIALRMNLLAHKALSEYNGLQIMIRDNETL